MPIISVASSATENNSMPAGFENTIWSSRPVKMVITLTPGATIINYTQITGLPVFDNFTEDSPGSGIWESYFDTTNGLVLSPGITTNCYEFESSDDPGPIGSFCFEIEIFPSVYKEAVVTVNGAPQSGTNSSMTNGLQVGQITGTSIITVPSGGIVQLYNFSDPSKPLSLGVGPISASITLQKLD